MPTMTSANNNQPHNQKYVTQSLKPPQDHYNGLCSMFSSHSLCCLTLKNIVLHIEVYDSALPNGNVTKRTCEDVTYLCFRGERMK